MCALLFPLARGNSAGQTGEPAAADWPDARGDQVMLNRIGRGMIPFSFTLDGRPSGLLLPTWQKTIKPQQAGGGRACIATTWADTNSPLRVTWELNRFGDFPAAEWLVWFENSGTAPTGIIENVQAMDLTFDTPRAQGAPFILHRTRGAPSDPTDFEPAAVELGKGASAGMGGAGGRSSNGDFPFFRIDTGGGVAIVAVGWSGQWRAVLSCQQQGATAILRATAGLERTRFRLLPGERVRGPRILVLFHAGDEPDGHVQFRRLILRHYAARLGGAVPDPILFCNTCFTRGGGWLNECDQRNQISLIRALAPLGVQAVITDAGWFTGGWPEGAGNWEVDLRKYPGGMGPVAAAARDNGMIYGLWFEPERVVAGTAIDRHHGEWVLRAPGQPGLLNFALPEVRRHFFEIVAGYMKLPGFRVYRQDFNMDPLANWRHNDDADRQGITEMKYVEGLYAYWDMIRAAYPDAMMEECASGGRRIDLETVMRFHVHQKSDYWFDSVVDQATLHSLARYLPNGLISVPLNRMDDYSFRSAMASSLITGWIADDPAFDAGRAKALTGLYRRVRHLFNGDWYALTDYSRGADDWLASQYHRPDLEEGLVLAFRRDRCPYVTLQIRPKGLDPKALYELTFASAGRSVRATGLALMDGLDLTLPRPGTSELITYVRR